MRLRVGEVISWAVLSQLAHSELDDRPMSKENTDENIEWIADLSVVPLYCSPWDIVPLPRRSSESKTVTMATLVATEYDSQIKAKVPGGSLVCREVQP